MVNTGGRISEERLEPGEKAEVTNVEGLMLNVKKA